MIYDVIFHSGALREFDKLPDTARKRLTAAIDSLAEEPRPAGTTKLASMDAYRIRVGAYRVAYAVRDDRLIVLIVRVGHRSGVYKEIETIRRRLGQ